MQMKIDYDVNLYKKIARLSLNEIVQVRNRNGIKSTIHIKNITELSWNELQLLISSGADRFTKMVLLYENYSHSNDTGESLTNGNKFTPIESEEINEYVKIYRTNKLTKHFEVNDYISINNLWDKFPTIRSLNDHGKHKELKGIQPKYFEAICQILNIFGEKGVHLDAYKPY